MSNIKILNIDQEVNNITNISDSTSSKITFKKSWKVTTENEIAGILKKIIKPKKSWSSQIIRSIKKVQEQNLIIQLVELLDQDWKVNLEEKANMFLTNIKYKNDKYNFDKNYYKILILRLIQAYI